MEISELDRDERIALIGLTQQIVKADKQLTPDEELAVEGLAEKMGADAFYGLIDEARKAFGTTEGMEQALAAVSRPEAQNLIFESLRDLAGTDGMDKKEAQILVWTAHQWSIEIKRREPPPDAG